MTSRAGNQYVMIAYHSSNLVLAQPFANRKDKHRIEAYNVINVIIGLDVDLQVLDNEVSKDYKKTMVNKWKVKYQNTSIVSRPSCVTSTNKQIPKIIR